jgi:hypothetical protein
MVKRERMLEVALGLLGLFYVGLIYPLCTDLAHSKWLLEMKDACEPMFLSWFITLGPLSVAGCQKAVVASLPDYLRRVPEPSPCFGNDHPNCGSVEAPRSSGFYGCCPFRRHRGDFAGTLTRKTTAERSRYPVSVENLYYP